MSGQGGLTAEELLASLRRRQAALPSEIGTFLVFEICEAVLAAGPVRVESSGVRVDVEGGVSLLPGAPATDDAAAARSVHALLTRVLLNARPGVSPRLMRLIEEGPSAGQWTLAALRDDLEASLVPLNRTASRRVLSRLLREAAADRMRGARPGDTRSFDDLDAELADLLGDPEVAEPARSSATPEPAPLPDPNPGLLAPRPSRVEVGHAGIDGHRTSAQAEAAAPASSQADIATDRLVGLAGSLRESGVPSGTRSRVGLWVGLGLVLLSGVLVGAVFVLRPDVLARLRGEESTPGPAADPLQAMADGEARAGELVVAVEPAGSQVLMRVGTAPVEVEGVAVGQAEEFVATAAGRAPSRAVIAPGDPWEKTDRGPFFELAMQTRPLPPGKTGSLGDSLLPVDPGTARRHDGRVRIVTAPRGAEVYRVVGFAPEVRIQNLDTSVERTLLVHKAGFSPQTLHIRPQDWPVGDAAPSLHESVKLERR